MIDRDRARYVAELAHLSLSEPEVDALARELSRILEWVEKLATLDTTGVEPTAHAVELPAVLREDEVKPGLGAAPALANAPERIGDGFGVPKIVE